MNSNWKRLYDLRDFTYDTGYLNGSGQSGSEQHKDAMIKRNEIYQELQNILNNYEEVNTQLLEACERARQEIIELTDEIEVFHPDYIDEVIAMAKSNK